MFKSKAIVGSLALATSLAATTFLAPTAQAVNFSGNTTGEPTWNRPLSGNPPTSLSGVGTAVPYESQPFYVTANGAYDFLITGTSPANWDTYAFLYVSNFDPTSQFTNVIIGNDDFPSIGQSGFNGVGLTANTQYFFVTSGFGNTNFGVYDGSITGGGDVILGTVPEPLTMLGAGAAVAFGTAFKRRKAK